MKNWVYVVTTIIGFILCITLICVFSSAGFLNILTGLFSLYVLWAFMGAGAICQIEYDNDKERKKQEQV